ncbi:hypothetical protein GEMRC1_007127 [Eukaryota sp. GEM-RC1]
MCQCDLSKFIVVLGCKSLLVMDPQFNDNGNKFLTEVFDLTTDPNMAHLSEVIDMTKICIVEHFVSLFREGNSYPEYVVLLNLVLQIIRSTGGPQLVRAKISAKFGNTNEVLTFVNAFVLSKTVRQMSKELAKFENYLRYKK